MGLIKTSQPALHGDQHLPNGSDPIPGLTIDTTPGSFTDWVFALPGTWAYWPLQEASGNAIDQGPTGADLTPIGTPAYHATGPNSSDLPYAVRLTGSTQNTIADDSFYDTADVLNAGADDEFTAICWIKPDSGASSTARLPIIGTLDQFRAGWVLYVNEGTGGGTPRGLHWFSGNGTSTSNLTGPPITMDAWSLVAVTRSATGEVKLYVDGSEVETDIGLGNYADNGHGIRLGAADFNTTDPDSHHFYGNMAGAVWVDHVLTGGEILDAYTAATGGTSGGAGGVASVTAGDSSITIAGTAADPTVAVATGGVGPTQLASTAVSAGTYGDATHVAQFTVDADGRLTAASNISVTGGGTFDPATATTWWFPLADSDGTLVLDDNGDLIPTLTPLP